MAASQWIQDNGAVHPAFARLMAAAAELFGHRLSEAQIRGYAMLLGDLSLPDLERAFARAARDSQWFPKISELRRYVEPAIDEAALMAWALLDQAVSRVGPYASLDLEDWRAAEALVAVFGSWPAFCDMAEHDVVRRRQEFLAAYGAIARQCRRPRPGLVRLPGLCESEQRYPTGRARRAVWVARLAAGRITFDRERDALPAHHVAEIPEARTPPSRDPEASS